MPTVAKYHELFEFIIRTTRELHGNSPIRQVGMKSPSDKYPLAPVGQIKPINPFNPQPSQDGVGTLTDSELEPSLDQQSAAFEQPVQQIQQPVMPKQSIFTDPALKADEAHKVYLLKICQADLDTVKQYKLIARQIAINLAERELLLNQREVLREKLLKPLDEDFDVASGEPAKKH